MKFKATIEFEYTPPTPLIKNYGTDSIEECLKIDEENFKDDINSLIDLMINYDPEVKINCIDD